MTWVILGAFSLKLSEKSFFALFRGELSTNWVLTGRFSRKFPEKSFFPLWVLTGRFSRKFPEKSFFALIGAHWAIFAKIS
ncbi:hypothetical protein T10_23 [Trichinella papuae]|uniref:Uncharacterized protein n=1 Tax=Trichinella papuae TaxID=268474 RepID=A0A0V1M0N6_9BILA|nr:hypothetical protein T10_23 [Trichinella papuae]